MSILSEESWQKSEYFLCFLLFRCREKQKKESGDVASENMRLTEANKMLKEENDGLQRKLTELISENDDLRNQVLHVCYIFPKMSITSC